MLANLSFIDVLTESHRSGWSNRTARHRLAPPAMLTDDSWATGKWKKERPACLCGLVFINTWCRFFCFQHSDCQFISYIYDVPHIYIYICCYCEHNAYFCVEITVMISEPPLPTAPLFVLRFYCLFLVESWNRCAKSFCFTQLWILTNLVHLVMYVCACACACLTVQCCSRCVDVSVTLRYFSLWLSDPHSPLFSSICHTPLPSTLSGTHRWCCGLMQRSSTTPNVWLRV